MCLETIFDKKRKNSEIEKLKQDEKGYIIAWKTVKKNEDTGECYSPYYETELHKGINSFKENNIKYSSDKYYKGGTHLFASKKDAKNWQLINQKIVKCKVKVVKCKVKKEWINTIGTQPVVDRYNSIIVLVCSKAILPEYISKSTIKECLYNLLKR